MHTPTTVKSRFRPAWAIAARRPGSHRAFTLLELLLVLAIVVIIAAVAIMATQGPMARQRLRRAADDVRSDWCNARNGAMETGHTFTFRYRMHGDRYCYGPQDDSSLTDSSGSSSTGSSTTGSSSTGVSSSGVQSSATGDDSADDLPPPVHKSLLKGILFLGENGIADLSTLSDHPSTEAAGDSGVWSEPILFYADGTTSDAQVLLAGGKRSAVRLSLRGVTGTVTVDDGTTPVP
jgi:prepilin-type N-terminal cleavage/methylation domain-containing protein